MPASISKSSSSTTDQLRIFMKGEVEKDTKDFSIADTITYARQAQASEDGTDDDASGVVSVYNELLKEVVLEVLTEKSMKVVSLAPT
jgi:hypothetical protein